MSSAQWIAAAALVLAVATCQARDFMTVGMAPVILYDVPSAKGAKLFVAPSGMPLEVMLSYGDWVKVRDVSGDLAWTRLDGLGNKHNVIVRASGLKVRATTDDTAAVGFIAEKNLLLEATESVSAGWTKVRHQDGMSGYVRNADVWGQ